METNTSNGNRSMLIIGNGLSTRYLAHVGFQNLPPHVDTFGMGAAYRYYRDIGWWPNYYALCDKKVVYSHRDELKEIIEDPQVTVDRFFFSLPVSDHERLTVVEHQSTGDFCVRASVEMGYKQIFLIGIDNNYIERIKESRPLTEEEYIAHGFGELNLRDNLRDLLIITATPVANTNYFFDQYQVTGDIYSLPRGKTGHLPRWVGLRDYAEEHQVKILNLSDISELDVFPKVNIDDFLKGEMFAEVGASDPNTIGTQYRPQDDMTMEEVGMVNHLFAAGHIQTPAQAVMFDVGAHKGGTMEAFLNMGWQIHAFEPDPELHPNLKQKFGDNPRFKLTAQAVSDNAADSVTFYKSPESAGVSSLTPFLQSHKLAARVQATTLTDYVAGAEVDHIDLLKIDTEGHDLMVLKGFPWKNEALHPQVIVCEFEDSKTKPLGYNYHQMAQFLKDKGYQVILSEWHPIIAYGSGLHTWHRIASYPCELNDPEAWGNLIAFKQLPDEAVLKEALGVAAKKKVRKIETPKKEKVVKEKATKDKPFKPSASTSIAPAPDRSPIMQMLDKVRGPRSSLILAGVASLAIAAYGLSGLFASQIVGLLALAPLLWAYHRRASRVQWVARRDIDSLQRQYTLLRSKHNDEIKSLKTKYNKIASKQ